MNPNLSFNLRASLMEQDQALFFFVQRKGNNG